MQESQRTHRQGKRHTYGSKDSQVESILMATQVALHHNWLPGTCLEHTAPGSTNPNPAGNICPSSQHFCYTGETAMDVAPMYTKLSKVLLNITTHQSLYIKKYTMIMKSDLCICQFLFLELKSSQQSAYS